MVADTEDVATGATRAQKFRALLDLATFRPFLTLGIVVLSVTAAVLEGIGVSFILPIVRQAQSGGAPSGEREIMEVFIRGYEFLGIPFTLEYIIVGVSLVIVVRYLASFAVAWLKSILQAQYVRHLQITAFERALEAQVEYFDTTGSDDILNAIVTQSRNAGKLIKVTARAIKETLISVIYFGVAVYLAPGLAIGTVIVLGGFTYGFRTLIESGYAVGDRMAEANERLQTAVQAGTQGIRDVKLFTLEDEMSDDVVEAVDASLRATVRAVRNRAAINNFYQLVSSITVFVLIYAALRFTDLSLAGIGIFLFAMYRLAPRVSTLNNLVYQIEENLPHLVRTQRFVDDLEEHAERTGNTRRLPDRIDEISFDDVTFAYDDDTVLDGISFSVERGEFVAFVGPSGAGKSTVISLLARLYEPASGEIRADGIPIHEFDIREWRQRVAVVRQQPFIFNETLRYNLTIGDRSASQAEIERACELAQVTEFVEELPRGYETVLGDDGVRLSGGQRQRVAIARALLKECDFILLDEATSDLDTELERTVHEGIESMDRDAALIVVAHRLSTVNDADRIYALSEGTIVESGDHRELLNLDGRYASLYSQQITEPATGQTETS